MKVTLITLSFLYALVLPSQVILNAYAKVTSVTGSSVLAVSNVNQANHTFNAGEKVIVMQMQDDVIGANNNNNVNFGLLSAIANAGNYEIRTILSRTPATGTPTSIRLSSTLNNTYNTGTNSSVQLISYRYLGNTFTTTSNITGLAWDGNVGGVIGIEVNDVFTLNHQIIADGIGFTGGSVSDNADESCTTGSYRLNDGNKGYKGEGIFKRTSTNQQNGRARIITGGGGGSENNCGGGGGGNFTAGGNGGLGYQCNTGNSGYGLGGVTLSTSISSSRVFMGGGGGGGQQNNSVGTNGGAGGGIILIKATTLITNSTCVSPIRISANGIAAVNSGNDGSGGGGAGGSIVLQVSNFSITTTCPLVNSGSGGAGGNVTDPTAHGGGGGGGQGVVIYSIIQPTANITTSVSNGAAGTDNSGGTTSSGGGGGTSGTGVVTAGSGPLPISLLSFYAEAENDRVKLVWSTASEKNNAFFTVERSDNGAEYAVVGTLSGAGTSQALHSYQLYDNAPYSGVSYYRLKQTDYSSDYSYSPLVSVDFDKKISFAVFPNPAEAGQPVTVTIDKNNSGKPVVLHLYDLTGKELLNETLLIGQNQTAFNFYMMGLEKGLYLLKLESDYSSDFKKLIVK